MNPNRSHQHSRSASPRKPRPWASWRLSVLSTALIALIAGIAPGAESASNPSSMQTAKKFHFQKTESADLDYLVFLPKDYGTQAGKRWPLIFFLHGAGERGSDVWKVAVHGPPKIVETRPDFPFIVVSPQCPEGKIWSNDALLGLLDQVTRDYAVDTGRIYLTGLSMGGYGTWSLGVSYPERFAAIVPICGGGDRITVLLANGQKTQALKSLGVWAFHGAKDKVVPPDESQRMVDLLKDHGVKDIKLTLYPEAEHDSWTETYQNPALYEWLLQHEGKQK
jgi:predicted peptidase